MTDNNTTIKEFTNNSKYVEYNYKLNTNNDDKNLKSIKRIIINTLIYLYL